MRTPVASRIAALIAAAAICVAGCAGTSTGRDARIRGLPRTVDEAVRVLRTEWLSDADENWILRNPKAQVVSGLHWPWGMRVRNEFELWEDNSELRASCGSEDPDACSAAIFARLWEAVRSDADPDLVLGLDSAFRLAESVEITYAGFGELRIGEVVSRLRQQVDSQLLIDGMDGGRGSADTLRLKTTGGPNLDCWARVEFSEDGTGPVPLSEFLSWLSWRNGFETLYLPGGIELRFDDPCAWPERPRDYPRFDDADEQ